MDPRPALVDLVTRARHGMMNVPEPAKLLDGLLESARVMLRDHYPVSQWVLGSNCPSHLGHHVPLASGHSEACLEEAPQCNACGSEWLSSPFCPAVALADALTPGWRERHPQDPHGTFGTRRGVVLAETENPE